jgi:hypothetical protein
MLSQLPDDICVRIGGLYAMMDADSTSEADLARTKLSELMAEWKVSWRDLPAILGKVDEIRKQRTTGDPAAPPSPAPPPTMSPLDVVTHLTEQHVYMPPGERLITGLWAMHTWVFDRFDITPRLAVLSPANGCGKSRLLRLISYLVEEPFRVSDVSAAAARYQVDEHPRTTLFVDEFDNLDLPHNRELRTLFNEGHDSGSFSPARRIQNATRRFNQFAPLCIAGIGKLPAVLAPLASRAAKIYLHRAPRDVWRQLQRPDEHNPDFATARGLIRPWAQSCKLPLDPPMPSEFYGRTADNYRPLFAIADDLGRGDEARKAAVALESRHFNDDPGVVALTDMRSVFNMHGPPCCVARCRRPSGCDRIHSDAAVEEICEVNDRWLEWRGPREDQAPHKLTQAELGHLLGRFEIHSKSIWLLHRRPDSRSKKGYRREQFLEMWARYCPPEGGTAAHPSNIRRLASD